MKILVLTANFAPRGASPAVRTVHLVQGLARLGHELKVVTYDRDVQLLFSPEDPSLSAKVPDEVEVIRLQAGLFHRLAGRSGSLGATTSRGKRRLTGHILSSLIVPDPHVAARRAFESRARTVIEAWRPDALLTFAYPFTFTLIGAALKLRHPELTWVADYGDPWTGSPVTELNLPGWRRALDRRIERRALAHADAVTVTTDRTVELYAHEFPCLVDRLHVLTMGYDPGDIDGIAPAPRPRGLEDTLMMVHAGRLYGEARDAGPFIEAVSRLHQEAPDAAARLRVLLLGEVEDTIRRVIEASPAAASFLFAGWVTVAESVAIMKSADWLLLFGNKGAIQVPGKLYQYIGTGRPVFMTREDEMDPTAVILDKVGRSRVVANEASPLYEALAETVHPGAAAPAARGGMDDYAWPAIAARLASVLASARTKPRGF